MSSDTIRINVALHTSRKHLIDMISDRGFDVKNYTNYTKEDILNMLNNYDKQKDIAEQNALDILVKNDKGDKLYVKYLLDEFKKNKINELVNLIYEKILKPKDTLIIIVNNMIVQSKNDKVSEYVFKLYKKKRFVQIFGIQNLMYNPSRHIKMPKHRILSSDEVDALLKKYNLNAKELPLIKREDPMAKYLGMREHDICEIIRTDKSSGYSIYYRRCVNDPLDDNHG